MRITVDIPMSQPEGKITHAELDTDTGTVEWRMPVTMRTPRFDVDVLAEAVSELKEYMAMSKAFRSPVA